MEKEEKSDVYYFFLRPTLVTIDLFKNVSTPIKISLWILIWMTIVFYKWFLIRDM